MATNATPLLPPQPPPTKVDPLTGALVPAGIPPPSPTLGFQTWASAPENAMKVQHAMVPPNAPLQPNAGMASANPPAAPPMASSAPPNPMQAKMGADQGELQRLQTEGAGLNKIQNPLLRGLAKAGDIALPFLIGRGAMAVPGTTAHNLWLQDRQAGMVGQDQTAIKDASDLAYQQAQTQNLLNPRDKFQPLQTDNGYAAFDPASGTTQPVLDASGRPVSAPSKPEDVQHLYSEAVADAMARGVDPNQDPKVQQLSDAITGLQRVPVPKEPAKDDRAIAIYAKPPAMRTMEENAYLKGYETYVDKTKVQPGVQRAQVYLQMPQAVADPSVPGGVRWVTRKDSIGQEAPQGIATQVPIAAAKDMTSGFDSRTVTAGNVLSHHLDLYDNAVDAVKNGDLKVFNAIGNEMGIQMGNDAQTNLSLIRQGVAMEAARYWTGGVPGDAEINQFNKSLSGDGSPAQMHGGASTIRAMAKGKLVGLEGQYGAAMQGQPNFGNPMAPPAKAAPAGGPKVGDVVTLKNGTKVTVKVVHPDGSFD